MDIFSGTITKHKEVGKFLPRYWLVLYKNISNDTRTSIQTVDVFSCSGITVRDVVRQADRYFNIYSISLSTPIKYERIDTTDVKNK